MIEYIQFCEDAETALDLARQIEDALAALNKQALNRALAEYLSEPPNDTPPGLMTVRRIPTTARMGTQQ